MGHLGRQRGWHEALKRRCASRSHKNFSILLASVNCRNGKTRRSFSTRLLTHHQPQNLHGSWISSPCIPKISSLYRVSAVGVGSTPTADTVRSSRYYCSASRPLATPRKPTVKPTFVVQNGPTKGKKNKEGALKSEPSRRTQSSETGDIQESKLVLARKQRRKYVAEIQSWEREFWDRAPKLKVELGADIHSLRKEITKRANRLLIPFIAVRQSYTEKIEYLRAERISRYPARWVMDMLLDIDLHIIDIRGDLITIEEAVRERIRSLIDLFKEKLAMGETKIARLTKKKSDLEFPLGFQRRERDRTAWWDSIEIAFDTEKNVNLQGVRTFAKITTNVSRDRKDLEAWFMEYNVQISDFRLENENQHHVRDRLYRIAAIVQEVLDNGTHIKYYAHFARTYRRIYLYSSFDHSVSDYELRYVSLDMLASKLRRGGRILKAHTLSHSAMFRGIKPDETTSRSLIVPTRLTDLGSMLADNAVDFTLLSSAFYFGVLSNERSPDIQLRRAQAAALEPFREVADNMLGFLTAIDYASEPIESKDTIDLLESYHTRLKYSWRRIREDITVFGVANWRSNEHRLSKRTVFLKPLQSQSSCLLSPVTFNVPPGYPTTSDFNYNDYRGPQGEKVQIFYCSDVDSMDSALAKLQHNGIVSIDVRWAPGKTTRGAYYTDWFGRDVSVLTVSTQSEIVVCHLAMCRNPRHKRNIPNPLIQLLEDATVIKVGLDVGRIRERFISYLSISMQPICDLAYLHRAVQMCSSTGAEYPTSNDFKYKYLMKRYYHKSPIAVSARQGMFWLTRPLLLDLQGKPLPTAWKLCTHETQLLPPRLMHAYGYFSRCPKSCWI